MVDLSIVMLVYQRVYPAKKKKTLGISICIIWIFVCRDTVPLNGSLCQDMIYIAILPALPEMIPVLYSDSLLPKAVEVTNQKRISIYIYVCILYIYIYVYIYISIHVDMWTTIELLSFYTL